MQGDMSLLETQINLIFFNYEFQTSYIFYIFGLRGSLSHVLKLSP